MSAVFWLVQGNPATAQDTANQLMRLSQTALGVDNGQLFGIDVQIKNMTVAVLKPVLTITPDEELELVTRQADRLQVSPGKSYFHAAKFRVPVRTKAQEGLRILFELKDSTGRVLEQQYVSVSINESRNIQFYILEHTLQIRYVKDVVILPVRLFNTGNTDEVIRLTAKVPVLPEDQRYITREFFIPAFTDTVLELPRETSRLGYTLGNFQATITATYADGDIAGIGSIDIQNLRDNKRYHDKENFRYLQRYDDENMLEVNGQYLFTQFESYQVVGGSSFYFNKALVKYNIDAQFWKDSNVPTYVRNTYLDIQGGKLGLVLGNINRNFDVVLSGRGAAVSLRSQKRGTRWELGAMDENNNLVGVNDPFFKTGKAAWLNQTIQKKNWNIDNLLLVEQNEILASKDALVGSSFTWKMSKAIRIDLSGAGSYSESTSTLDQRKYGGSGEVSIQGRWNNIGFSSENEYASPYYPGIKRGVSNFNQRVYLKLGNFSYGASYSTYQSRPEYVTPGNSSRTHTFNDKLELSFGGQLSDKTGFVIMPLYFHELSKYYNSTPTIFTPQIWSYGSGVQINYSNYLRKKFMFVYAEFGSYSAPMVNGDAYRFHAKVSASARLGWLNLSVYKQLGEFYAGDVANRIFQKTGYTEMFNVTPTIQHKFFRQRLDVEAGFTYSQSSVSATGIQLNGRVEYTLQNQDKVYTSIRNYQYEDDYVATTDFRLGYRKALRIGRIATGRKRITVFVFQDTNVDGVYNEGTDSVVQGAVVSINKELLITDRSGIAIYKGLPEGKYTVFVPSLRGWYGAETVVDLLAGTRVEIPLHKNSILNGKIIYRAPQGITYEEAEKKDQLLVQATNANGKTFTTKTNEDGSFVFFIPPGKYDVSILSSEYSENIECADCLQAVVLRDGGNANIVFNFAVKERKVKLQKFVSPNIKKQ